MFVLMTKAAHEAAMAVKNAEIAAWSRYARINSRGLTEAIAERDALQAKIDRMTAPLRAANEARKLKAAN